MGSLNNYAEDKILAHIIGETSWPASPTAIYLALYIGDPTDAGTGGVEVSAGGYSRKVITFGAAASRAVTQSTTVTFDEATASWGTVNYWALFDASSGGNMLAYGQFSSSRSIVSGNTPSIAGGEITISFNSGGISTYLANAILNHIFNDTEYTAPSNIYLALTTAAVTDASTGATVTELAMTSYAPEEIASWETVSAGASSNSDTLDFGTLTGTGETVEGMIITDNSTTASANILFYDNTVSQAIASGDAVQVTAGDLSVSIQ